MARIEKLVELFLREPPLVSFRHVVKVLEAFGYEERPPAGGSHRSFAKPGHRGKTVPTINNEVYQEILKAINDIARQFEKLPATYKGKSEEELRDHILLHLQPGIDEGTATGESFNKKGRTDILIRHEGENILIVECKIWDGAQQYLNALSQLLTYLTFRDSKSALIIFVKNKEFTSVLKKIEEATPTHPNFLKLLEKKEETWFNYIIHLNGDPKREISLAVLAYHIPYEQSGKTKLQRRQFS